MSDCSACCSAIGKIAPAKARSQVISGEHIFGPQPSNRNSSSCIASPVPKADPIGVAEKAHSTGRLSALDNPLGHPSTSSTATDDQSLSREDTRVGVHVTASSSGSPLEELLLQGSRVTGIAQNAWEQFVREGYTVVDATCGNGFDSKWLAEKIGPQGQLVAFDIQEDAIRSTKAVLEDEVDPDRLPSVHFVQGCHSTIQDHVKAAHFVCFNLGFLPGGDRSVISRPATTVAAVEAAMRILVPRGIISVLAYVGHPGGYEEYKAVQEMAIQIHPQEFTVVEQRILNRPNSPVLILLWRRP